MLKLAILSVSILTVFASAAISPAMAEIAAAFPAVSALQIKSLLTAPALAIVFTSPMAGLLSQQFGSKPMLVGGLVCYLLGGVGGAFVDGFSMLYATRLLLGVGVGIIMPTSSGLISERFHGQERLQMMAWSTSANSFGSIICSLLAGYLALISWRHAFFTYSIGLVSLAMALRFLPASAPAGDKTAVPKGRLPAGVWYYATAVFLMMVGVYSLPLNLALHLAASGLGGAPETGVALAIMTAASLAAGLSTPRWKRWLGARFAAMTLLLLALGFGFIAVAEAFPQLLLGMAVLGIGSGMLVPYLFVKASEAARDSNAVAVMGMVTMLTFLGQFCSPFILDPAVQLLRAAGLSLDASTAANVFWLVGLSFAVAAVANAAFSGRGQRHRA